MELTQWLAELGKQSPRVVVDPLALPRVTGVEPLHLASNSAALLEQLRGRGGAQRGPDTAVQPSPVQQLRSSEPS